MSLILDALKRSEGERQEKTGAITLGSYSQPPKPRSNRVWIIVGGLLLINLLVVGWLLMSRAPGSPAPTNAPVAAAPSAPAIRPPAQPQPAPARPASPTRLGMQRAPAPRPAPMPRPAPPARAASDVSPPLPARPLAAEALHQVRNRPKPAAKTPAAPATTISKPPPASASANRPPESAPATKPAAPSLDEAPDDIRAKLAAYEINAHVYSDEPAKRFTLINMQRYQEGDTLPGSNFRIEKITPTGVLIDYGRGEVLMPITRY